MRLTRSTPRPFRARAGVALALLATVVVLGTGCRERRGSVREVRTASAVDMKGSGTLRIETRSADVHLIQSPDDTLRVIAYRRVEAGSDRAAESLLSQIKVTMERQADRLVLRVRERGRSGQRDSQQ